MVTSVPEPSEVEPIGLDAPTVLAAVVTFALAYLLARAVGYVLVRLSERSVDTRITVKTFIPLVKFLIYVAALYYVLGPLFDLSSAQILAFSGVLGAVLAFGVQELFANVAAGIVITFERPYRIGDKIEIRDYYGEVVDIGIRSTKIATPDDDLVSVPNYLFFTDPVANANAGKPEMMTVSEFYLSPEADQERAAEIVYDALRTSRYVYISDELEVVVRTEDAGGYTTLLGKAYVNDVRNEEAFVSDVTRRSISRFEEEGIERAEGIAGLDVG